MIDSLIYILFDFFIESKQDNFLSHKTEIFLNKIISFSYAFLHESSLFSTKLRIKNIDI